MIKSKGLLLLLLFLLIISISANVYSFKNINYNSDKNIKETEKLKEEIEKKEKEINTIIDNKKLDDGKKEKEITEDNLNEKDNSNKANVKDTDKEVENSVKKFIEYAFSNNEEDYTTRKKLAENYMTDDLIETLFSADGINEDTLKLIIEIEDVEVFPSYEDNEKIIVRYVVNESKAEGEYNESIEKYSEISIEKIDNSFKVTGIKPLTTDDWGI